MPFKWISSRRAEEHWVRIDSLVHITADGSWFDTSHSASIERLLLEMNRANVTQSVLAGLPSPYGSNNEIMEAHRKHPDRFIPVAALDLKHQSNEEIERQIAACKKQGFAGVKVHPRLCSVSFLSQDVDTALKFCGRYDMPVYLCTVAGPPLPPLKRPLYDVIHELCDRFKSTRIVLLHGGYYELLQTSEVIRPYENVLLDLSATLTRFYDSSIGADIRFLLRTFEKRICIGSDFPEFTFSNVMEIFDTLGVPIFEPRYRGLLGQNLQQFLGLN